MPGFVEKLLAEHADLDCLINNAGVQRPLDLNSGIAEGFGKRVDEEIDINIRGPMHI